jgi:hypothetical protein
MSPEHTRRRLLAVSGAIAASGLAGCGGSDAEAPATEPPTETEAEAAPGVPDAYATATAIGGSARDPDSLSSQEAVQYQAEPNEGEQCSNCQYYIPDKNGDGLGACSIVEGTIDPEAWCVSFVAHETEE